MPRKTRTHKACEGCGEILPNTFEYFNKYKNSRRKNGPISYQTSRRCSKCSPPAFAKFKVCTKCKRSLPKNDKYFKVYRYHQENGWVRGCTYSRWCNKCTEQKKESKEDQKRRGVRICSICGEEKPLNRDNFNKKGREGFNSSCIVCRKQKNKKEVEEVSASYIKHKILRHHYDKEIVKMFPTELIERFRLILLLKREVKIGPRAGAHIDISKQKRDNYGKFTKKENTKITRL